MKKNEFSFELKSNLAELDTLCHKLEQFGKSTGLTPKCIFEINLALDELFTNIITYGYCGDGSLNEVKIHMRAEKDRLVISVEDQGIPFNPNEIDPPEFDCSPDNRKVGGLGIHLIKSVMDEIAYQRRGNKNILTLKKSI